MLALNASHIQIQPKPCKNSHLTLMIYAENDIETFIANISSSDIRSQKTIEYLNPIHEIGKEESIPLDQISMMSSKKLEEKKKIEEELREADFTS